MHAVLTHDSPHICLFLWKFCSQGHKMSKLTATSGRSQSLIRSTPTSRNFRLDWMN